MTWAEFKKQVEVAGVTDDMDIRYIDVGLGDKIEVEIIDKGFGQQAIIKDA